MNRSRWIPILLAVLTTAACQGATSEQGNAAESALAPEAQVADPAPEPEPAPDWSVTGLTGEQVGEFLAALQSAVASDDRAAVAALASYPMRVNDEGGGTSVASADDFVAAYEEIFTEKVRERVAAQQLNELFVNSNGVMIGDGEVWFSGIVNDDGSLTVGMIAVNR